MGFPGSVLGKHGIDIANMSLAREVGGGEALTVLEVDTVLPQAALDELAKDPAIKGARVATL